MHQHGWIDQGVDGLTVCPGDYIVTVYKLDGSKRYYPIHKKVLEVIDDWWEGE